jgi:Protein of unknown function (DUF4199)
LKSIHFKNGIFGGLIVSSALAAMTIYMKIQPGYEPNAVLGFGFMLLAYAFVVRGILQVRKLNFGTITFRKSFVTGLKISLIISTMYVVVWLLIHYLYFPDFIEKYGEMVLKNSRPEDLVAKTAEINQIKEWYKNPVMIILLTYMEVFPLGILVSLVAALILKKK